MDNRKQSIKIKGGQSREMKNNEGKIFITGTGRNTYLWVGNDAVNDKACFGWTSGPKSLEKFARNILKALGKS